MFLGWWLSFLLVSSQYWSSSYGQSGASDDTGYIREGDVVLGGLFPVHANLDNTCGNILTLGIQRLEAMVHAIQQVNSDSKLLPGLKLGFAIKDTCINSNRALEQSLTYVTTPISDVVSSSGEFDETGEVFGVVGAASSSVSIAVASLFRLFDVPQISYASTAKFLSDKTRFDYFFRTISPDLFQARVMVDILVNFNWTYVISVCSDDTYGLEGIKAVTEELNEISSFNKTFSLATTIKLPIAASEEAYNQAVSQMNNEWIKNATVVVLFGQLATAEGILRALSRKANQRPLTLIVSDAVGDQLPPEYHTIGHGMISVLPKYVESASFNDYFTSLRPDTNPNPWFREYWSTLFNCSFHENAMDKCDPLIQINSYHYKQNSKVPFVIDAVNAFAYALHNLLIDTCGEIKLCSKATKLKDDRVIIDGKLLLRYIRNVSFVSVSSEMISFDAQGDVHGEYVVKNLQRRPNSNEFYFNTIGTWAGNNLNLTSGIEWSTNNGSIPISICSAECSTGQSVLLVNGQASSCWTCEPCPRDNEVSDGRTCSKCSEGYSPNTNKSECQINPRVSLQWSNPFALVILTLALLGLVSTVTIGGIFIINFNHSTIKASSRELSTVLLTGIFLCYLLPFFSVGEPIAVTCAIQRFGFGFSFSLCYAALLVKANRIHRIFNRRGSGLQRPPLISPQSQLLFTGLLVSIQVVLSASWLVIQQPGSVLVYHPHTTEVKCRGTTYFGLGVSLGYNFILLLVSTYFAFRTRKIPQDFNEAKFINLTLYSIIIIWLAFIPAYFGASRSGAVYETAAQLFAIELSATTTLCSLFISKLYFLFSSMKKEGKRLLCFINLFSLLYSIAIAKKETARNSQAVSTKYDGSRRHSLNPDQGTSALYISKYCNFFQIRRLPYF